MPSVHGIHHVTCIAADPQQNLDSYAGVMGLRLVKKSVNQDVPDTYHLFYADARGTPGTDLTFFPWPDMDPVQPGVGLTMEVDEPGTSLGETLILPPWLEPQREPIERALPPLRTPAGVTS